MKPIGALLLVLLGACAHLGIRPQATTTRLELWDQGHRALQANEFARADSIFTILSQDYPASDEGRESLFYLGVLRLDPRNPNWDPHPAEDRLKRYLASDSTNKIEAHRRPEAEILLEIAHQLNLPPAERILGLQPGTTTEIVKVPQRIVMAAESEAQAREIADLRQQIVARDAQIKKLEDELERIRRTLTNGRRP
jgi:hypothetical protein